MSVKQLLRFFCFAATVCASIWKLLEFLLQLLFIVRTIVVYCSRSARTRGAVREPLGSGITPRFTFWGHLFHTQFCTLPFTQTKIRSSSKHVPKMVPKFTKDKASNRYTFCFVFFVVSRGARKSEHVFVPCLCSPNHFGHRLHGTRNGWKNRQKRYTNSRRKHD